MAGVLHASSLLATGSSKILGLLPLAVGSAMVGAPFPYFPTPTPLRNLTAEDWSILKRPRLSPKRLSAARKLSAPVFL